MPPKIDGDPATKAWVKFTDERCQLHNFHAHGRRVVGKHGRGIPQKMRLERIRLSAAEESSVSIQMVTQAQTFKEKAHG